MSLNEKEERLFKAIAKNDIMDVKTLLEQGDLNINAIDDDGYTPLLRALNTRKSGIAHLLINSGADVNNPGIYGSDASPLHLAVCIDDSDLVRKCLEKGADPDARARGANRTPLHFAALHTQPDIVLLLLEYGANPNLEVVGFTALATPMTFWKGEAIRAQNSKSCFDDMRRVRSYIRKYDGYFINHGHEDVVSSVEMNLRDLEKIIPEVADYRRRERMLDSGREETVSTCLNKAHDVGMVLMGAAYRGEVSQALYQLMKAGKRPDFQELINRNNDDISVLDVLKRRSDVGLLLNATPYWIRHEDELKRLWQEHLHPWQRKQLSSVYENLCESMLQYRIRSRVNTRNPLPLRRPRK